MTHNTENLLIALDARKKGIATIPCHARTKQPRVKWKRYQSELPSEELLQRWFQDSETNIAIVTTGMVLFDCETLAAAEFVLTRCGATPYVVRTPGGGVHLGYARADDIEVTNHVRVLGKPIDIRTDGGLAMIPNAVTPKGAYSWLSDGLLSIRDLPVADIAWIHREPRRRLQTLPNPDVGVRMIRRARGYVSCIEGAISGQRGHDRTMRVAGVLVQKFGLSIADAWPIFLEWNEQCEPPWSEKELLHKLEDAQRLKHQYAKRALPSA